MVRHVAHRALRQPRGFRPLRRVLLGLVPVAAAALALAGLTPAPFEVVEPEPGAVVGVEGVEVMVRFPSEDRIAVETFRVLLNGADATEELTTGANGAYGRLYGLLDGENVLRFEAFGRRWWLPRMLLEEAREVHFLVRLPQTLDRV